jgi:hypothetical protein
MSENTIDKTAHESVKEQFKNYGEYVCLHRHIPNVLDGLKPSYKRMIQGAFDIARDKKVKSATLIGHTIGTMHPHGLVSLEGVLGELVHSGIFDGQGNFGYTALIGESAGMAASRYTEAGLSSGFTKLLTPIMKYVPTFTNELGFKEYEYIPVPIPLGLTFSYLGIAIGTGCKIPAFTPKSLIEAYLNDDPKLLKNANGLIIENPDELSKLWTTGRGHIRYRIKSEIIGDRIIVEGHPGAVKPNFSKLLEWRSDGRVDYDDESSSVPKVAFYKMPRVQYPSFEEIVSEVEKATRDHESYYIRVVANNQVRDVGIKTWIDITYKNYLSLLEKYKTDHIEKDKFDILVYSNFRKVADILINDDKISYDDVASKFNIPIEVVNTISQKSIHQLRTSDPSNKIKGLEDDIKKYENLDTKKYIIDAINMMG